MTIPKDDLQELLEQISAYEDIKLRDIPDIDLYMDQVTTFIEKKMGSLKRKQDDKMLTKTMINNYSKAGILMPPSGKKYSREHIVLLILIYYLKQILPIKDIKLLMEPLLNKSSSEVQTNVDEIYEVYLDLKKKNARLYTDIFNQQMDLVGQECSKINAHEDREVIEMFLAVMILIDQANIQKRLIEMVIDRYFK